MDWPRWPALLAFALISGCAGTEGGGPAAAAPHVEPGNVWTYRQVDAYTGHDRGTVRYTVSAVDAKGYTLLLQIGDVAMHRRISAYAAWTPMARVLDYGRVIRYSTDTGLFRFPLAPGDRWVSETEAVDVHSGEKFAAHIQVRVRRWEAVITAAGSFDVLRLERVVYLEDGAWYRSGTELLETDWYSPEARAVVKSEYSSQYRDYLQANLTNDARVDGDKIRAELVEFNVNGD